MYVVPVEGTINSYDNHARPTQGSGAVWQSSSGQGLGSGGIDLPGNSRLGTGYVRAFFF